MCPSGETYLRTCSDIGKNISRKFRSLAIVAAGSALVCSGPVDAGFLNIGKHTPPPAHKAQGWDWTGSAHVVTYPAFDGFTSFESCKWVALDKPYAWRFSIRNDTGRTVSLYWGPFEFQKGDNPFMPGKFVRRVILKAHQSEDRDLSLPLGCPNMRGGQNDKHYYYVISDHIRFSGDRTFTREGFFAYWNAEAKKVQDDEASSEAVERAQAQAQLDGIMGSLDPGLATIASPSPQ